MDSWLRRGGQNIIQIFSLLRVSTFQKRMMSCPNRQHLGKNRSILQTRMGQRWDHMKINFHYFQIQKCYTVRAEKVDEKMGSYVQFPCSLPKLWSLNCLKMCIFCNFVLTSARNLSPLKQFTYMHLKGLVTQFQKMVLFITL